jgi:hypothetical protein
VSGLPFTTEYTHPIEKLAQRYMGLGWKAAYVRKGKKE